MKASPAVVGVLENQTAPRAERGDATLTVVIFTDYQCPACRKAAPALQAAVAHDGHVRVIYRDWPIFGEISERAANVALAGHKQGIYPALHHELMRSSSLSEAALKVAVERVGGDWQRIQVDLRAQRGWIESQLSENRRDAFALGFRGTPGYLIGLIRVEGALTESEFVKAFKQARSEI